MVLGEDGDEGGPAEWLAAAAGGGKMDFEVWAASGEVRVNPVCMNVNPAFSG